MKRNYIFSLTLSSVVIFFMASTMKAAQSATPPSNLHVTQQEDTATKTALQPLRDKLFVDRQALIAAVKIGDKDKIAAARKTVMDDFVAIREKSMKLRKNR